MRQLGQLFEVGNVDDRIAHGLRVEGFGVGLHRQLPRLQVGGVDEGDVDAHLAEGDVELLVGAAVQRARGHEVVARLHEREDGDVLGGLARRRRHRADAVLQRGDALLKHRDGRIHDPRVDVPEALQGEQVGGVVRVLENVGAGLVDGHRARARDRVRPLPRVHGQGVESELLFGSLHAAILVGSCGPH